MKYYLQSELSAFDWRCDEDDDDDDDAT